MCGIAGFLGNIGLHETVEETLARMGDSLAHRGPDSQGTWMDSQAGFAVVHRRLSIIDLSDEGRQPMLSPSGRYVVSFNGEIYNFRKLRDILLTHDYTFRGHSDTEVLLGAIEHWGLDAALNNFVGMFAFALWDRKNRELFLVRDRLGEKPLYYGWVNKVLLFASELKALRVHPFWRGGIDRDALSLFLRYCYIPTPYSIHPDIFKVVPGRYVKFSLKDGNPQSFEHTYWSLQDAMTRSLNESFHSDEDEIIGMLDEKLKTTIKEKMIADVPLGAFLSGGIDSSTIVAIMQAVSNRPVKTFTIGFTEKGYNESSQAKAIAAHLGTDHTELIISPNDAFTIIPDLANIYDEPFADSSQIPTFLVSRLAKKSVTVSLSGDGGDEVFGGYNRYINAGKFERILKKPLVLREMLNRWINFLSPQQWERLVNMLSFCCPRELVDGKAGDKLYKFASILTAKDETEIFSRLVSTWQYPEAVVLGAAEVSRVNLLENIPGCGLIERMMITDTLNYLPDDILVKLDRAAMAVSLEGRVPFLDHRLIEFAWRIPTALKVGPQKGKLILKNLLSKYVPQEIIDRPKKGFAVPIGAWMRHELRDWVECQIDEKRLKEEGYFLPGSIRLKWEEHLSGRKNWHHHLWNILMFQSWLESTCD